MLSFDKLCNQSKKFSRLTGVKLEEFHEIARKVRPKWNAFQKKKKVAGCNSKIRSLEDEVLLVLIYYRFYVSFQFLGALFGLDESNACRHLKRTEKMLASVIKINKNKRLNQSDLETLLINATEIQIQRPTKKQRKFYSGKKKRHMTKFEVITSAKCAVSEIKNN